MLFVSAPQSFLWITILQDLKSHKTSYSLKFFLEGEALPWAQTWSSTEAWEKECWSHNTIWSQSWKMGKADETNYDI